MLICDIWKLIRCNWWFLSPIQCFLHQSNWLLSIKKVNKIRSTVLWGIESYCVFPKDITIVQYEWSKCKDSECKDFISFIVNLRFHLKRQMNSCMTHKSCSLEEKLSVSFWDFTPFGWETQCQFIIRIRIKIHFGWLFFFFLIN